MVDDGGSVATLQNVTVNLKDVNEKPLVINPNLTLNPSGIERELNEGDETTTKLDFTSIYINAIDPEGQNLKWKHC